MIRIFLDSLPIAKKRHRSGIHKGRVFTYDPQKADKIKTKWVAALALRDQGLLKPHDGPIELHVVTYYPFPKSWPKKRKEQEIWKTSRPDCDNNSKFYMDVLSGIAYKDDAQVVQHWSEKKYSVKAGIEILLIPKEVHMVNEHAITIREKCSIEEISFLVKKANRLGKADRDITHVYTRDDPDGSHVFFEVTDMKERRI